MSTTLTIQASEHPVKSVTVFKSSKAEIVRTFKLDLKHGQNKVEIKGLSSFIDTHSVRVSGLGAAARLCDVVCTLSNSATDGRAPDSHAEVTRILRVKRQALEAELAVRERELEMLSTYGGTLTSSTVNPAAMGHFLDTYVSQSRKSLQAAAEISEKILDVVRQIDTENEKIVTKLGSARGQADVVFVSDEDAEIELKLTYIVSQASWTPTYELHAKMENGKPSSSVILHYRARITQSTGEDWNGTALTLSTVTSGTVVRRIPQLRTTKIRPPLYGSKAGANSFALNANPTTVKPTPHANQVGPFGSVRPQVHPYGPLAQQTQMSMPMQMMMQPMPMQQMPMQQMPMQQMPMQQTAQTYAPPQQHIQGASFGVLGDVPLSAQPAIAGWNDAFRGPAALAQGRIATLGEDFEDIATPARATESTTIVVETPMAISFSVHGNSTIPSDGVDHQVSVAILPFESKISYITVPRVDARVFLQCEVKNTSEYRLLPGPVTVILDDSYVSKTSINDINTGDTFHCTLGDDTSTRVIYERSAKTIKSSGGAYSEVTNTTYWYTKISIHNKHHFSITDLIVRDVIPTCEDNRAKIVLRKPIGLAEAKDGQMIDLKNDGLKVGWDKCEEGRGGEKEGKFEWRWKVGNGAKVTLEAEWEVKAPGEDAWIESFN